MNTEDIIGMAQEALLGSSLTHDERGLRIWIEGADWHDEITRLAKLAYKAGAAAEREACAKVCESLPMQQEIDVRDECAAAIRARSQS